jgi:hypothetical protein
MNEFIKKFIEEIKPVIEWIIDYLNENTFIMNQNDIFIEGTAKWLLWKLNKIVIIQASTAINYFKNFLKYCY